MQRPPARPSRSVSLPPLLTHSAAGQDGQILSGAGPAPAPNSMWHVSSHSPTPDSTPLPCGPGQDPGISHHQKLYGPGTHACRLMGSVEKHATRVNSAETQPRVMWRGVMPLLLRNKGVIGWNLPLSVFYVFI